MKKTGAVPIYSLMKDKTDGDILKRYTTGVACKSWHGSLNPSDSYVPFIVSYPGGDKAAIKGRLDEVCAEDNCKGNWKLPVIVKDLIKEQYH